MFIKRKYLEHQKHIRIHHTRIYSKVRSPVAQIVMIHGWASSSNFIEVSKPIEKMEISLNSNFKN